MTQQDTHHDTPHDAPPDIAPFALPRTLAAKSDPSLIDRDREHFARIATGLERAIADLEERLAEVRRTAVRHGTAALERDQEVHRLTARLRALRRYDLDLCLGRIVHEDRDEATYIGRFGLADADGRRLLVDWRSPAAEPFFAATHAHPQGLVSRRRYRWMGGRIVDYWDEAFTDEGLTHTAALDDQSAFIATLGGSRTPRMRDVLGTIQADQDAIVRAGSRGALVVDGGPGTGKTVVALHRTAYLLYADPRLGHRRGGVLFVGPHAPYLAYVGDVLPSLGEEGVQTCTVRDLVPEVGTRTRGRPAGRRAQGRPADGRGDRAGRGALRGAAHGVVPRRDRRGATSGSPRPSGPRPSTPPTRARPTTSPATTSGTRSSRSSSTRQRTSSRTSPPTSSGVSSTATPGCATPSTGPGP